MNKKKMLHISISFFLILFIIITFVLINEQLEQKWLDSFSYAEDNYSYAYQIEKIDESEDKLVISGWFFLARKVRNKEIDFDKDKKFGILLYDINSDVDLNIDGSEKLRRGHALSVTRQKRNDINEYYSCEYDYSDCGFVARIDKNLIDLENGIYQIIIKPDCRGENGIDTNAYIDHGLLKYYNPEIQMELDVEGTDLENIVENGVCLLSDNEIHVCIYQHEKKLYWIVDEQFTFEEDGSTLIQFQLDTTQYDKLPEYRKAKGWYWVNDSSDFEKNEVTHNMNCGRYRVSVRSIPEEYSISAIITGYYIDDNWIWKKTIRPVSLY